MATNTTAARIAFELLTPAEIVETLKAVFYHCKRKADVYNLRGDYFDALNPDDVTGAAYIHAAAILDKLETLSIDDDRREWPLARVFVRAMCKAIEKTYKAEHGNPSALVYLDALPDNETRAAVIDTAARACGKSPVSPESAYLLREAAADALHAVTVNEIDRLVIKMYAAGYTAAEIAQRHCVSQRRIEKRIETIRERAAALPDFEKLNAAETLSSFGEKYRAAQFFAS